ncbi:MAG: 7-cyano-7-deazaguanine synthase QueC [Bacteroidaceae bacterium]
MKGESALVVFSGGQDSTTCLYWAKAHFSHVYTLSFTYGQKHVLEIQLAKRLAAEADVPWECMDLSFISQLSRGCCSLTDNSLQIEENMADGAKWPSTFVPGRNFFFLSVAAVYARSHGIRDLVTGVGQADFSGYPDCRDSFIKSLNVTLNLAMDEQFRIHTPLMWLSKAQTWALADRLGVMDIIRKKTLTCYNGVPGDGCGHCPSCRLRMAGLQEYLRIKEKQHE